MLQTNVKPSVFLSYNWAQKDYAINLEEKVAHLAHVIRDENPNGINAWGNINDFMEAIKEQDFSVLLLSDEYLKSANCMYEFFNLLSAKDWDERVKERRLMLIVFDNAARIYNLKGVSEYVEFWKTRLKNASDFMLSDFASNPAIADDHKKISSINVNLIKMIETMRSILNPSSERGVQEIISRLEQFHKQRSENEMLQSKTNTTAMTSSKNTVVNVELPPENFKIGFSFTGEFRKDVLQIKGKLYKNHGYTKADLFYDDDWPELFMGVDADIALQRVYKTMCNVVVVCLSKNYNEKDWTGGIEWRAIREIIAQKRDGRKVILVNMDNCNIDEVDGLSSRTDVCINYLDRGSDGIAELITKFVALNS